VNGRRVEKIADAAQATTKTKISSADYMSSKNKTSVPANNNQKSKYRLSRIASPNPLHPHTNTSKASERKTTETKFPSMSLETTSLNVAKFEERNSIIVNDDHIPKGNPPSETDSCTDLEIFRPSFKSCRVPRASIQRKTPSIAPTAISVSKVNTERERSLELLRIDIQLAEIELSKKRLEYRKLEMLNPTPERERALDLMVIDIQLAENDVKRQRLQFKRLEIM
jgi:hypothetical protein